MLMIALLSKIFTLFLYIFLTYALIKYVRDKDKTYSEYLIPELKSYGFEYISSKFCFPKAFYTPAEALDQGLTANSTIRGLGAVRKNFCRHVRRVEFEALPGARCEALALIEFDRFFAKKPQRIQWKHSLESFEPQR